MSNDKVMQNIIEHKDFEIDTANDASLSPEQLYENLITIIKLYHPSDDISLIEKAYKVAKECHGEQKRKSGEPYIIHPLSTAIILAQLELDKETIVAGLLHDVIEDTTMTKEEVTNVFGDDVAELVDGVTKLTQLSYDTDKVEEQAENLRKMFLAMAKDIRVILIKLADRLHNMRTLQYMTPEKQREKARETMDIYSPIANRLGISKIKTELDDLSLKYLEPDVYNNLTEEGKKTKINNKLTKRLSEFMSEYKVILFSPDEMKLVKESPNIRRNYLWPNKKTKKQHQGWEPQTNTT